jgi:hypothetical protein
VNKWATRLDSPNVVKTAAGKDSQGECSNSSKQKKQTAEEEVCSANSGVIFRNLGTKKRMLTCQTLQDHLNLAIPSGYVIEASMRGESHSKLYIKGRICPDIVKQGFTYTRVGSANFFRSSPFTAFWGDR